MIPARGPQTVFNHFHWLQPSGTQAGQAQVPRLLRYLGLGRLSWRREILRQRANYYNISKNPSSQALFGEKSIFEFNVFWPQYSETTLVVACYASSGMLPQQSDATLVVGGCPSSRRLPCYSDATLVFGCYPRIRVLLQYWDANLVFRYYLSLRELV